MLCKKIESCILGYTTGEMSEFQRKWRESLGVYGKLKTDILCRDVYEEWYLRLPLWRRIFLASPVVRESIHCRNNPEWWERKRAK